jgi:hypothetical protein
VTKTLTAAALALSLMASAAQAAADKKLEELELFINNMSQIIAAHRVCGRPLPNDDFLFTAGVRANAKDAGIEGGGNHPLVVELVEKMVREPRRRSLRTLSHLRHLQLHPGLVPVRELDLVLRLTGPHPRRLRPASS